MVYCDRIYLPSETGGVKTTEYLLRYVEREFPGGNATVHSVPRNFRKGDEKQAVRAERVVFRRLHGLSTETRAGGLWMLFFHGTSYAGQSFRNRRDGKLMIREHDFVGFVKYDGKRYIVLVEVKANGDPNAAAENLDVTSDAKAIKNNKRSAQHQLGDHLEVLGLPEGDEAIQTYIMWPFLRSLTRDPKRQIVKRWPTRLRGDAVKTGVLQPVVRGARARVAVDKGGALRRVTK